MVGTNYEGADLGSAEYSTIAEDIGRASRLKQKLPSLRL